MDIEMRDMGFGEMVILTENNDKFIIDCGYSSQRYWIQENEFLPKDNGKTDLLITHFHEDHYKGLLQDNIDESKVYFEHCYLSPLYYQQRNKELISILTAISPIYSRGHKEVTNLILLMKKISKISKKIRFVKRGNVIKVFLKDFKVLWPEYGEANDEYQLINEFIDENNDLFKNSGKINDLLKRYIKALDKVLNSYNNERTNQEENGKAIRELFEVYEELRSLELYVQPKMKRIYRKYLNRYIKNMNETSVVLKYNNKALFLGDVTSKIIDHLIDIGDIGEEFEVIKINHHGTPGNRNMYFCDRLPLAKKYLISNSSHKMRKIDNKYLHKPQNVICTYHIDNYTDFEKCEYKRDYKSCTSKCLNHARKIKI